MNTKSVIKYNNALNDYIHPSLDQPISFSKPISIIYSSVDYTEEGTVDMVNLSNAASCLCCNLVFIKCLRMRFSYFQRNINCYVFEKYFMDEDDHIFLHQSHDIYERNNLLIVPRIHELV